MNLNKFKYVACDLDGTSLHSEIGFFSKKTINSILNYQKLSGDKFFIATGRSVVACRPHAIAAKIKLPLVVLNGAVIYDYIKNKPLFIKKIDDELSLKILKWHIDNNILVSVNTVDKIILTKDNERAEFYISQAAKDKNNNYIGIDIRENQNEIYNKIIKNKYDVIKYTSNLKDDDIKKIRLVENFLKTLNIAFTPTYMQGRCLIDIFNISVNKGTAIKYLSENIFNVDYKEIIALGDNNNDFEFIKQSNWGITLKNGIEKIKQIAYKVIDKTADEDGVAFFLDELIKNNGEIK